MMKFKSWQEPCGCKYEYEDGDFGWLYPCSAHEAELKERENGPTVPAEEFFAELRAKVTAKAPLRSADFDFDADFASSDSDS